MADSHDSISAHGAQASSSEKKPATNTPAPNSREWFCGAPHDVSHGGPNEIYDSNGKTIAQAKTLGLAAQICAEHNAAIAAIAKAKAVAE